MSETMSSPSTDDWAHFYQPNNAPAKPPGLFTTNQLSDATTVTTTSSASSGLSPEGRVSKPVRRRSRASRRTPTTLLNTDTANFRAMVQQFTGGPLPPFASSSSSSYPSTGTDFSFGLGTAQQIPNPNPGMDISRSGYINNILEVQQQQQLQQQQQFMFSLNSSSSTNDIDDHHAYLTRLERSTLPVSSAGGFRVDGVSSSVSPIIRSNYSSSKNLSEENYML